MGSNRGSSHLATGGCDVPYCDGACGNHGKRPRLLDLFCGAGGAAMGSDTELAWAAGFFDGEGSVSVRRDKRPGRNPCLNLDIEQTELQPLLRFARAIDYWGNVHERPPRAVRRRTLYRIAMGHEGTHKTIDLLWPYLSEPKKLQFKRALEECQVAEK